MTCPGKSSTRYGSRHGMTLMELLVGIILAGVFMTLIYHAYNVTSELTDHSIQRMTQLEESQLVMEQIVRDLHASVKTNYLNPGEPSLLLASQSTTHINYPSIIFIKVEPATDTTPVTWTRVTYNLGTVLRVIKTESNLPSLSTTNKGTPDMIIKPIGLGLKDTLYVLKMECLDRSTTQKKETTWSSTWINKNTLPVMVRIELELKNNKIQRCQTRLVRTVRLFGGNL